MDNDKRPLGPDRKSDYEPDTHPVSDNQPTAQESKPVVEQKTRHKHGRAFSFVSILLLLTILALGIMAYFWYAEYDKNSALEDQNLALIQEKSAREAREEMAEEGDNPDAPVAINVSDEERVIASAQTFACVINADACDNYSLEQQGEIVEGNDEDARFAKVVFSDGFAGGSMILKNTGEAWVVVSYGQSVSEEDKAAFNIPDALTELALYTTLYLCYNHSSSN